MSCKRCDKFLINTKERKGSNLLIDFFGDFFPFGSLIYNVDIWNERRTAEFSNLAILSFVQVGLESLEGLPNLPMLSCLNLSDNKLTGGLEVLADKCPDLAYIILSGNSLKDIDVLKPLAKMDKLLDLELCNTGLDDLPDYRMKVFKMLPHLKHLDGVALMTQTKARR
uniref:U2A'/phosphoprotein 32 family A C-terminal domain-containing protein n=1 Tax=Ditylenchus dipsaci TaxID=166011 RepID=A0A915E447_9BILA